MKLIKSASLAIAIMGMSVGAFAQVNQKMDLSIFPKPEKGFQLYVIEVPQSSNDGNKKIELFVGKEMETDGCNRYGLMGEFKNEELTGWGYEYYKYESKGEVMSTMIGCPDASKQFKFVSGQGLLTDYNGRMPILIYVPEGLEVKYKIYNTDGDMYNAAAVPNKTK